MLRLYGSSHLSDQVDPQQAAKFEDEAGRFWDLFYKRNSDRFFKDRHYFDKEWPQLTQGKLTVLEVGCGAGNTVFPLLGINPSIQVYACDFSPRAVELVRAHPEYARTGRVSAFVADITQHEGPTALAQQLPGPCVDYCSMVFVLSAVAPHKMRQSLRNVASVLKPGVGRVLFRDYADGDLAQTRLQDSQGVRHIRGNFYARGDGTCCYYFDQEELSLLFAAEGFVCESSIIHARTIENRKSGVKMPRRWIQAVFRYDQGQQPPRAPEELVLPQLQEPQPQQEQQQQQELEQPQDVGADIAAAGDSQPAGLLPAGWASTTSISCAGRTWQLPSCLLACHSSSSSSNGGSGRPDRCGCCVCLAEALVGLVGQRELQLLGRCLLLAPPWLQLQAAAAHGCTAGDQTQQQPQQQQAQTGCCCSCPRLSVVQQHQQQQHGAHAAEGHICPGLTCSASRGWATPEAAQQQGAAAALLALVSVWLGAKRVYACLPDSGSEPAVLPQVQEPDRSGAAAAADAASSDGRAATLFVWAFNAVIALNESRVVVERIRPRLWQQGSARHAPGLQRAVVGALQGGVPGCQGLVVVAGGGCNCGSSSTAGGDAQAQQVLSAVCDSVDSVPCAVVCCARSWSTC